MATGPRSQLGIQKKECGIDMADIIQMGIQTAEDTDSKTSMVEILNQNKETKN